MIARGDPPPPIPCIDALSYFDPASVGGAGPLTRITTQQRERVEAEARERAGQAHCGVIANADSTSHSLLRRLGLLERDFTLPQHKEESQSKHSFQNMTTPSLSSDFEKYQAQACEPSPNQYTYPDGGYGWVVVVCCMALAGCCMG